MAVRDVVLIGALVFMFGVGFFIIHHVFSTVVDDMVSIPAINESNASVSQFQSIITLTNRLDYVVFGLFIALTLALIITGWFVGGHPIFMFIYSIVVIVGVVLGTVLANVWETATQSSIFGATIASFPITNNLILNLPIYMAVIGFIGIVVMFAKPYSGGNQ